MTAIRHLPRLVVGVLIAVVAVACASPTGTSGPSAAAPSAPSAPAPAATASEASGSQAPNASAATAGRDEVCEAAAADGTFTEWGGEEPETTQQIFERFMADHAGIEPEFLSIRPSDAAQRIATEAAAGQLNLDLFSAEPATLVELTEREIVDVDVDWETYGVPADLVTTQNALRFSRSGAGLVYNTELVTEEELPTTWEELIDPKWEGQVIVDPRGRPWDAISLEWGAEKTIDYVQRLKDVVKPLIIEGTTAGMVAVGSGEAKISTNGKSKETLEQQEAGAPVEIRYLDVTPADDGIMAKIEEAPHENAAICYGAWLTGEEGQATLREVALSQNDTTPPGVSGDSVTVVIEDEAQATEVDDMAAQLAEIWTGQ